MNLRLKETLRRALPASLALRRIWSGPLRGHRIYTSWHDYPGALLGTTERPLLEWFRRHVRPGETWLDVGGHYGYTSLALSELVGPEGRVFCFEPVAASAQCIERTMVHEGAANVRTVALGLSSAPEMATLALPRTRGMADSTVATPTAFETIRHVAFDALWPSLHGGDPRIHGIKIDVQGLELEVLRGMLGALESNQPKLAIEFHRGVSRPAIIDLLASRGYRTEPRTLQDAPVAAIEDDVSYVFLPAAESTAHYDAHYFGYQKPLGEFGGWADLPKFRNYLAPDLDVVEFGCGGGYLLERLQCRARKGIEVNPSAREAARQRGLDVHESAAEIPDAWAGLVVSNHALEHCANPLAELRELRRILAPGGRAVFVVPCESVRQRFQSGDINRHLYTWSPGSLGNLFEEAGFAVEECAPYIHVWPPRIHRALARISGALFHACARLYGALTYWNLTPSTANQIRIVARAPGTRG